MSRYKKDNVKKYKNYLLVLASRYTAQEKGSTMGKKVKKANSPAHPLARDKKEFIALIIKKSKLIKYYFKVSVIRNFFKRKK